tara:strand:- start:1285 stop:1623 length:339 start_codon:yes stop_codon:yes gene_type:complete
MKIILNDINAESKAIIFVAASRAAQAKDWGAFDGLEKLDINQMEVNTVVGEDAQQKIALSIIVNDSLILFSMAVSDMAMPDDIHVSADVGVPLSKEYYNQIYLLHNECELAA